MVKMWKACHSTDTIFPRRTCLGFCCMRWYGRETTRGTLTCVVFHIAFLRQVIPRLNPWPIPRSIVVLDNTKSHALEDFVHACGAILLYLPPYSPHRSRASSAITSASCVRSTR
ncbi:TPA: hypothetical protein N0F65_002579 [Lagenidium giganteum]|uniref:Transposase n=1 Tax=Lagenidium giganteum TaxID=4803 RepID=A0AAV2YZV8_9STRA|nr:TPA: hypothetical protein N0F65_002579 [Lagenidium giganteum]